MRGTDRGGASSRMPWHGWLLGGLLLLYGLAAAFDHGMSLAQGEAYYRASGMSEPQVAYFSAQPAWAIAGWTLSVWAGPAGSLAYIVYLLVLTDGRAAMGVLWAMPLVLAALMILMVPYSVRLARGRAGR